MPTDRDAYQRGHRDALLSLAADLDALAQGEREHGKRYESAGIIPPMTAGRLTAYTEAARRARRSAESLPHDPEEVPDAD